ncbi:hypothetical protein [Poseidonocella sedimentorum]|uniref:Uncharacterized protein n=1 Tax=Poseidonocella sedimentorum TaxID=871652 RepID=A0A1I6ENL1_9RHOB|nr:hypothetical protein [Poseidonocella sedimentorum]SFR19082.1 hypothetical protein SAMN04515673_11552 [Poseidonocella sedimentorum]
MTEKVDKNLARLKIELRGLERANSDLANAKDSTDAHLAWANFVRHLKLSLNLVFRIGKDNPKRRPIAWKRENFASADKFVRFMVQSRNHIDHPEDEFKRDLVSGELLDTHLIVAPDASGGGLMRIPFGQDLTMINCSLNGHPISGTIEWAERRIAKVVGNIPAVIRNRDFYVSTITDQEGKSIPVPLHPNLNVKQSAGELAKYGVAWIDESLNLLLTDEQREFLSLSI